MKSFIFVPIALFVILTGCDTKIDKPYKSESIANFVISCANQGQVSIKQCSCFMDEIRKQVSYDKFVEFDMAVSTGQLPEELTKVLSKSRQICF